MERAYWTEYGAVLIHPWVARLVADLDARSEHYVLQILERLNVHLRAARTLSEARLDHIVSRLTLLEAGCRTGANPNAVAAGEFLADYLLLQRMIAQDVWLASRRAPRGESTAAMLDRLDTCNRLHHQRALCYVLNPDAMHNAAFNYLGDKGLSEDLRMYVQARPAPPGRGVLAPFVEDLTVS